MSAVKRTIFRPSTWSAISNLWKTFIAAKPARCFWSHYAWAVMPPRPMPFNKQPWSVSAGKSAWRFKLPTICSMSKAPKRRMGKRVGKDSQHGKLTFPSMLGVEESRRRAATLINEASASTFAAWRKTRRTGSFGAIYRGKESMMEKLLSKITSPRDLAKLSEAQLEAVGPGNARSAVPFGFQPHGPFRFQSGRRRIVPGPAHRVRFQPRSADLGHRPSNLSTQTCHRPLQRFRYHPH